MANRKPDRRGRGRAPRRGFGRRLIRAFEFSLYGATALLLLAAIAAGALIAIHSRGLPSLKAIEGYTPWNQTTQVLAADGTLVGEFFEEDRVVIGIDKIPDVMEKAIIAVEDERFDTSHPQAWVRRLGIDPLGITRAFVENLKAGRIVQGGSTITQQLAKNLFFDKEKTMKRKIQEMILAYRIERDFSRDEILERYLNKVFFGNHAYGIHSAATRYYGIDLERPGATLTLGQAAMLAGLVKAPSAYAPHRNKEAARERQRLVLTRMADRGYIESGIIDSTVEKFWKTFDPEKVTIPDQDSITVAIKAEQADFFVEYVRREMLKVMDLETLYKGGWKIKSTLDPKIQTAAENAMQQGLARLNRGRNDKLEGALVAIDHKTGHILAMVGGSSWSTENQFNRAVQAKRQAGSAFKPFVYLTALESGDATLGTVLRDQAFTVPGTDWTPKNYDGSQRGPVLPRYALTHSLNIAAVRTLLLTSAERVLDRVKALGIDISKMHPYPSMALGAFEVSLLEMTSAFSAIANAGTRVEPYPLLSYTDRDGRPERNFEPFRKHSVLSEEISFLMTSMLQSVVQRGTAASTIGARLGKIPAAGKTGTTDDYSDAWFVGFTPTMTVGVWIGYDERRPMGRGMTGGRAAGPIWADFVLKALAGKPAGEFAPKPEKIISVSICSLTGLRASPDCPPIPEFFIDHTAPDEICTVHSDPAFLAQFLYGDRAFDTGFLAWPDHFSTGVDTAGRYDPRAIPDAEAPFTAPTAYPAPALGQPIAGGPSSTPAPAPAITPRPAQQ